MWSAASDFGGLLRDQPHLMQLSVDLFCFLFRKIVLELLMEPIKFFTVKKGLFSLSLLEFP